MKNENFYITTSIPYASKKPHIGNTYEAILTDAIARFKKMQNFNVCFCTGVDEHGQKIEELAKNEKISPGDYAKNISDIIKKIWEKMNCDYDIFIRTTDAKHVQLVQQIFKKLYDSGDIYKGEYEGWYCTPCESFWTKNQLVDDKCPECGRDVKKTKELAYFLKVGKYEQKLIDHIAKNKDFITPSFYADEILNNFLKPGLQDFCISRKTFEWGVKINFDPEFVIYVWLDALINYISALDFDITNPGKNFKNFWPANLHVVGKDILRFHATIWPIILMMLELPLPKQILVHQWLLYKDSKMSKSCGNVVYADDLAEFFSVDTIRYYVLKVMSLTHDGSISYENIISVYNTDLANTIGNLVKRVCDMICKYLKNKITKPKIKTKNKLSTLAIECFKKYEKFMEKYETSEAIAEILNFARECNKNIDETMPWVIAKDESKIETLKEILYVLAESIRFIGIMLLPIIPDTATKILEQINFTNMKNITFESLCDFGSSFSDLEMEKPSIIFSRIDKQKKLEEISCFFNSK